MRFVCCCVALLALAIPALPGASGASQRVEFGFASDAPAQAEEEATALKGLEGPAQIVRDGVGVPHVYAKSEHDAYFLVGYLHAQDRLFQMDQSRRQASGTLAELLGSGAIASDVQLRTIGLRRAAARSLEAVSPQSREVSTPTPPESTLGSPPPGPTGVCGARADRGGALDASRHDGDLEASRLRALFRGRGHRRTQQLSPTRAPAPRKASTAPRSSSRT